MVGVFDDDELDPEMYPSVDVLDQLADNSKWASPNDALALMRLHWHWPKRVTEQLTSGLAAVLHATPEERFLVFSTGGWSGNEGLIYALKGTMMWYRTWRLSTSGGLHVFRLMP